MLAPVGVALAAQLVLGALADLGARARLGEASARETVRRLAHRRAATSGAKRWAMRGSVRRSPGIACVTAWSSEGYPRGAAQRRDLAGRSLCPDARLGRQGRGANFSRRVATVQVGRDGRTVAVRPEKRFYPVQATATTEAAIDRGLTRDLYLALGDAQKGWGAGRSGPISSRSSNWIWIGRW